MLASVLNTKTAVQTSIQVVKAFVELRELLLTNEQLSKKLHELEKKYDKQFGVVFKTLKQLIDQPKPERRKIGFK
jgi:phage regulator Rha-like protein